MGFMLDSLWHKKINQLIKEKAKYYVLISNIIAKDTDTQILTGQDSMMVVEFYKE